MEETGKERSCMEAEGEESWKGWGWWDAGKEGTGGKLYGR